MTHQTLRLGKCWELLNVHVYWVATMQNGNLERGRISFSIVFFFASPTQVIQGTKATAEIVSKTDERVWKLFVANGFCSPILK